jgi:hypothetical protein
MIKLIYLNGNSSKTQDELLWDTLMVWFNALDTDHIDHFAGISLKELVPDRSIKS